MKKMKFKELWKLPVGKFLYIWLIGATIYAIYVLVIDDILLKMTLGFYGIAVAPLPIWVGWGYLLKKKKDETGKFEYHRIFEYIFFVCLFLASFSGTFFAVYVQENGQLDRLLFTGLAIGAFTFNGLIVGLLHFVYGLHD